MTKQFEQLIEEIKPANMNICLKSLMIPAKVEDGEDWKQDVPSFADDIQNNMTVPLIVAQQIVYCKLTEHEELTLESLMLENFQTMSILNDAEVHVHVKDSNDYLISYYAINGTEVNTFANLWQSQKIICVEFRFYVGDSSSIKIEQKSVKAMPPKLLFAIGGVWDENKKSWMYEPFSQPTEVWPTVRIENL